MSAEATGWVYRHSPYRGAVFAVHHAIADSVNDQHDNEFWMALGKLAMKARLARPTVSEAVAKLTADGFIESVGEVDTTSGVPNRYRFLFPDAPVVYETRRRGGVTSDDTQVSATTTGGVTEDDTNPSNPRDNPPNPPQGGGNGSPHDGSHPNCRQCGTNPRGPKPPPSPHPANQFAERDCKQCGGDRHVEQLGGIYGPCPRCKATGREPSRRVS